MASKSSMKDSNVQELSNEEGERLFLMELSEVCYVPETSFRFIRRDVVGQLLIGGTLSRNLNLRAYMKQICSNPWTAFDTIVKKYSDLFPYLEINETIFLPIRTKCEIQSYFDSGIAGISTCNIIDLASAFFDNEIIVIRSICVNFERIMLKNLASEVKSNQIKNVICEIPKLFVCMYGFGSAENIILATFRDIFVQKMGNGTEGAAYVSLRPGLNIEKYIECMNLAKVQKLENVIVKYLVYEMRKVAGESGIIFGDEIAKIINRIPEKLYLEICSKYGCVRNIVFKYTTIFQPISKNSKLKKKLQFAYYLPCDDETLDSSKLSKAIPREIPPKQVLMLHEHFLNETTCLEHIYKSMLPQIDSQFTLTQFEKYLRTRAGKYVKKLVFSFGIEKYLKIHLKIFPVKYGAQNLYGRVSQSEFHSYLDNKERMIFSDEIKKLAEADEKATNEVDSLKVTALPKIAKILNVEKNLPARKVAKKLNTCSKLSLEYAILDRIYAHMLPNIDEHFTLAQFRKFVKTLVDEEEKNFIQSLGYENFLKRHLKIFPLQWESNGSKFYCRVSQSKFMNYVSEFTVSNDEKKGLTQLIPKPIGVKNQLTFNECIYMNNDESYVDFLASLLKNQPDRELRFLTSPSDSINRQVQTHSSGLVSSVFLYPI